MNIEIMEKSIQVYVVENRFKLKTINTYIAEL